VVNRGSIAPTKLYFSILLIFILVQTVILFVWNYNDRYEVKPIYNERTLEFWYTCSAAHLAMWVSIEISIFLVCFIGLTIMVYRTWSVMAIVVPSFKWILLANYNLIFTFILIIPVIKNVAIDVQSGLMDDTALFVIIATAILFTTTWSVLSLVVTQIPGLKCCQYCCEQKNESHNRVWQENAASTIKEYELAQ